MYQCTTGLASIRVVEYHILGNLSHHLLIGAVKRVLTKLLAHRHSFRSLLESYPYLVTCRAAASPYYSHCRHNVFKTCHNPTGIFMYSISLIIVYFSQQLEGPCIRYIFETASKFYLYSQYRYSYMCCAARQQGKVNRCTCVHFMP